MACDNCHIDHTPEDWFLDEPISDCSIDMADLLSFSDYENVNEETASQEHVTTDGAMA